MDKTVLIDAIKEHNFPSVQFAEAMAKMRIARQVANGYYVWDDFGLMMLDDDELAYIVKELR